MFAGWLTLGTVRRCLRPIVMTALGRRFDRASELDLDGLHLTVPPTVFHPRYFGTSRTLAQYVDSMSIDGKSFLEIGCGSGIIALHAARAGARVTAVDVNPAAVEATLQNAATNGLSVEALTSDLFEALNGRRFDVVAWNPPFFKGEPVNLTERSFFAGQNLETIARFASELPRHLSARGAACLIFSADADVPSIRQMFENHGMTFAVVRQHRWGIGETFFVVEIRSVRSV